jgi:hypothetical protein
MTGILDKLRGGDRRSIGRSEEVVADVLAEPELFGELFKGMLGEDPVVRMRAADAAEKVSNKHPEYLQPYKTRVLSQVALVNQQEVRWHVAQMIPRLKLSQVERQEAMQILTNYLSDRSKIVQTFSLQAMADLAKQEPEFRPQVLAVFEGAYQSGSPAVKSRIRKLMVKI